MKKSFAFGSFLLVGTLTAAIEPSESLLISASKEGRQAIVESLIQNKVDPNVKTNLGETPIIAAALAGHTEVVKLLVENGGDVNAQLKNGDSPLHIAIRNGNLPLVKLLKESGATIVRPFTYAITFQQFEVASYLYGTYVENILNNGNATQLRELLEPYSHYKQLVHLPLAEYIEQLSQKPQDENTASLLAVLHEFSSP